MADENGRRPPVSLAYQLWLEKGKPTLSDLARILRSAGYVVDLATLSRWKDKDPKWLAEFEQATKPLDPAKAISALERAKDDATELTPEHFVGVKAQLVARLYDTIKTMHIDSVEDWLKALDACERIEALIHTERGKIVAAKDAIALPRGASPSLLARLDPQVSLAPFKKAGGH